MKSTSSKAARCAIYTRVSTDQGLDQDFNSLDAQSDASQAYIRSQAHAGWTLLKAKYDDGGFSGGNTERPALQRLLEDVRAGKVDVIVVYMIETLGGALPSELVVLAQECRQLEHLQVMSKQKLGRIGHDAVPVSKPRYVLAAVIATWAFGRYG